MCKYVLSDGRLFAFVPDDGKLQSLLDLLGSCVIWGIIFATNRVREDRHVLSGEDRDAVIQDSFLKLGAEVVRLVGQRERVVFIENEVLDSEFVEFAVVDVGH